MRSKQLFGLGVGAVFLLALTSCERRVSNDESVIVPDEATEQKEQLDSVPDDLTMNSRAAGNQDANRKFIKTASADFETKDVYKTARAIEQKVSDMKGFIVKSTINSYILEEEEFETSSDSVLQVRKVQIGASMLVKIPQEKLGVFLDNIKPYVIFLNNRNISADDVTLTYERNDLDETRLNKAQNRVEKNQSIVTASDIESEKIEAIKRGKELVEKIKMSEVQLDFRQKPLIVKLSVPNTHKFKVYERQGFFYDVWRALVDGFYIFQKLILIIIRLWPIWLVVAGIAYYLRWRKNNKRSHINQS